MSKEVDFTYIKKLKQLITEDNRTILLGVLTILILFWIILYLIPDLIISLFNTGLGNIILIIITILVGINNYKHGLILAIIFTVLYRFSHLSNINVNSNINNLKENFELQENKIRQFIQIQHTINPHIIFDTEKLKEQVTEEDIDYFLKNGRWNWSPEVKKLYIEAENTNPYIRTWPKDSINYAIKIYNQRAILQIISLQTKEGQFLTSGITIQGDTNSLEDLPSGWGNYGYKSGLITPMKDIIKCKIDAYGNNSTVERIHYTGKGGIMGEQTKRITSVNYEELPEIIPDFKFINGPCNPCVAVNSQPDYTCPFELNIDPSKCNTTTASLGISDVWKYIWGLDKTNSK